MLRFTETETFGMTATQWAAFFAVWLVTTLVLYALNRIVGRRASRFFERTETRIDDYIAEILNATRWFFLAAVGLYAAVWSVEPSGAVRMAVGRLAFLLLLVQAVIWFNRALARYIREHTSERLDEDPTAVTTVQAVGFVGRLAVYSIAVLLALSNIGVEVGPLVASLGIGGIAIALALQNVLGDLFASLSIVLDKPFEVGDFLSVGDLSGTVERVGLKTTRVRSLSGEQLVFSNADLLGSRIRNFKRMEERRASFGFGVTYQTRAEQLEAIPGIVRAIIEAQEGARFDRAHFKAFGDSSLDFEVVYYVSSSDYLHYMDLQQAINLGLYQAFEREQVEFAYPTQTLHIAPSEPQRAQPHQS